MPLLWGEFCLPLPQQQFKEPQTFVEATIFGDRVINAVIKLKCTEYSGP